MENIYGNATPLTETPWAKDIAAKVNTGDTEVYAITNGAPKGFGIAVGYSFPPVTTPAMRSKLDTVYDTWSEVEFARGYPTNLRLIEIEQGEPRQTKCFGDSSLFANMGIAFLSETIPTQEDLEALLNAYHSLRRTL